MGDGVTDDKDLTIKVSDKEAGTTKGQLILDDVSISGERDNTTYSGIGNEDIQAISYGNQEYSVSATAILNGASAELARDIQRGDYVEGWIRTANSEYSCGKLHWDDWEISASDDGEVTFEANFTVTGLSIEGLDG